MPPISTARPVKRSSLHKEYNDVLTFIVFLLGLYLIAAPLLPNATYYTRQVSAALPTPKPTTQPTAEDKSATPLVNTLSIPSIKLNQEIHEGTTSNVLQLGPWHRPGSSTPDQGGNTVIVGHRFYKSKAHVFYHLDKIKKGDDIDVYWSGKTYRYRVETTQVVLPSATYIENNTEEPILTLYTCTPLWTSTKRLVVQARLIEVTT